MEKTFVEEARLNGARARLSAARESLATYSVAILESSSRTAAWHAIKVHEDEAKEKREKKDKKLLRRKLPTPKDGWLGKKGIVLN